MSDVFVPHWCFVGAKVACTENLGPKFVTRDRGYQGKYPSRGEVCIIAEMGEDEGTLYLFLADHGNKIAFNVKYFRPLVEDSDENGIEAQFYHKRGLSSKPSKREVERA